MEIDLVLAATLLSSATLAATAGVLALAALQARMTRTKGAIFVDHTTASAEVARELYEKAAALGIGSLAPDAPAPKGAILVNATKSVADSHGHRSRCDLR